MKKFLSILLSVILIISICPMGLFSITASAATSGTIGDCTWKLDGTSLTITGSGKMTLPEGYTTGPWGRSIEKVVIEEGVENISEDAFFMCTSLVSVEIPNSVTIIEHGAFESCKRLENITIPASVTLIEGSAFEDCTKLTTVNLKAENCSSNKFSVKHYFNGSLTYQKDYYGPGWKNIETLNVDAGVKKIGKYMFNDCKNLSNICYDGSWPNKQNVLIEANNENIVSTEWNYSNTTDILVYEYNNENNTASVINCAPFATTVIIPESITENGINYTITQIENHIFSHCKNLKSVYISNIAIWCNIDFESYTLNPLCAGADLYLDNVLLTNLIVPTDITSIGRYAFASCKSLSTITIPDNITKIGVGAFSDCNNIDITYYGGTETQWKNLSNKPECNNVVFYNKLGIKITLPNKTQYNENDEINLTGGKVSVLYNGDVLDKTVDLSNSAVSISGFDSRKIGTQDITVKYLGETSAFQVTVTEKPENTTEFAGGKGFDYSPYLISTKEHLNNVRKYPDAYFKQLNDIEFTAADFASGGTYYNNGYGWMPIGKDSNSAFSGTYDGGGYSIKNLKVDITTANSAYGGLFGYCTGNLKNITIENSDIKVTASGTAYAGGIVGYHKNGTIENCHNNNTTVNAQYGGGIIGYSYYGEAINNCSNSGNVNGINTGGVVGYTYYTDTINNCSNSGNVDGTYVGGIVGTTGYLYSISDCTNSGDIIKSKTSGAYIGGIVGYNKSGTLDISDCSNSGEIYAEGTDLSSISLGGAPIVGGIVGYSYNTNIENCSNSANIYGDYAGGIIGYGNTIIRDALNTGNISARTNSGGIVGYHNDGSVYTSTNRGDITGVRYVNGNVYTNYSTAVGGIIGAARNGSGIYECANLGTVSNGEYTGGIAGIGDYISQSYNNGTVNSVYYSGGICGDFLDSGSKILNCYNSGKVSGKYAAGLLATMEYGTVQISYNVGKISATESGGYVAAIIAYQTGGTVIDCYYLDDINIGVGYVDYSISNTPETTKLNKANMQNSSNFDGFDFNTIWTMDGNADYLYPELQNVEMIYPTNTWINKDGIWYYFNASGNMMTGWHNVGGSWYYFNGSGAMATGWIYDGAWYYMNSSGTMATGWQNIGGTWYFFNTSGAMATGWVYDGAWYYMSSSGAMVTGWQNIGGTWYYFNTSGAMATGWVYDGAWYYMDASGAMLTGWQSIGGTWYYFNDGAMVTGWQQIGGTWYYFNAGGAMLTGWQSIGGTWYYFYDSGAMAANCWIDGCWLNASGAWA